MDINKFDLLVSIYIFCIAMAELMGAKTFPLPLMTWGVHLNASVGIFVIPVLFSINDIIVEVYGKKRARSVVLSGLIVVILILLFSILATSLPPSSRFLTSEKAYEEVFTKTVRISLASLSAFVLSELLDVYIFSKLREILGKKALWLRNNLSNFISQFVDTAVFIVLAFYAMNQSLGANSTFLFSLILPYWLLKCFMSVIETPFVYLGVNWLNHDVQKPTFS